MAFPQDLWELIRTDWAQRRADSAGLERLREKAEAGKATYKDADAYAVAVGDMLARTFAEDISQDILPSGRMTAEIANAVVRPALVDDHGIIADFAATVQKALNESAGLGLNAVVPGIDYNRIQGIIDRLTEAEDYNSIAWILGEPVRNFSQNVADESARLNFEAQSKSGLSPKIIRTAEPPGTRSIKRGKKTYTYQVPCKWCAALAGVYDYKKVQATGSDVYRRHEGCRCIIEYSPDGVRRQNVHTKTWATPEEIAQRKAIQPPTADKEAIKERINAPIQFSESMMADRFNDSRAILLELANEYKTKLQRVATGAAGAAGDVQITGAIMRLNTTELYAAIHEFAHTLAGTENATKFGIYDYSDFWKEIKKIQREYRRAVENNPLEWISAYEHGDRSASEFLAEAFALAIMREKGLAVPAKYGLDSGGYSNKVLAIVKKYFGKN